MCVLACMACLGCSFLFTNSAPDDPEQLPPDPPIQCTTSNAAPVIDTIVLGYQVVRTLYALSADEADYANQPISQGTDVAFGLVFTGVFGSSAIYGFNVTSACSDAKELQGRRYREEMQDAQQERELERARQLRRDREAEENEDDDERPSKKRKRKRKQAAAGSETTQPAAPSEVEAPPQVETPPPASPAPAAPPAPGDGGAPQPQPPAAAEPGKPPTKSFDAAPN
jgi:hypothetical protein